MSQWLESNLSSLEQCYPALAEHLRKIEPKPPEDFDESRLISFASDELDAHWSAEIELHIVSRFILSPLAWNLFDRCNLKTIEDNQDRRILFLDDRPDLLRWSLEQKHWRILTDAKNCLISIGATLEEALEKVLKRYPEAGHSGCALYSGEPLASPKQKETLSEIYAANRAAIQSSIQRAIPARTAKPPFPRTIRFFAAGHNYIQDACVAELTAMGYDAARLAWRDPLYRFVRPVAWAHEHRKTPIDCGFFLNATPRSATDFELFQNAEISSMAWFVDNPRRFAQADRNIFDGCDVIGVFDRTYIPYLRQRTSAVVVEARTAYGIDAAMTGDSQNFSAIDIAFVGELGTQGFLRLEKGFQLANPDIIKITHELLHSIEAHQWVELDDLAPQAFQAIGAIYQGSLTSYVENFAAYLRRRYYLDALKDHGLRVFGDAEWNDALLAGPLTDCYQNRRIDYQTELASLYANAKINVNIFHAQCLRAPNPRVYDVLASGGFLLTTHNPGLEDEFAIGEDLDVFRSREELVEKTQYYLAHPEKRIEMAQSGKQRALANCGYHDRMQKFLSAISQPPAGEPYVYICQ